ncbi:gamma-glutamyl-gamma-aminobutyrate hydrolase family protein [Agilicoccus flavus]|uniref:gamma-glutamyl-gamma-aminobutyrate hydrolase family protein n=1 Tax=Agilicoccus flavus TaxID=2775968 RepID=UPI001CF68B62|nr:gamma-glutamyl-gamma-aminobutyrate hydrolase family protein [Agilicoccus flavus]
MTGHEPLVPPVIGVTSYVEPVDRGDWIQQRSAVLPYDYVAHVERAGGVVLVIPPRADMDDELAGAILDRLDGLVIAGGADVDPEVYGQDPHPAVQEARPERDRSELALVRGARRRGLPLLGVCRGMQIMAVEAGGSLEQHLPDRVGHDDHSPRPGVFGWHRVDLVEASRIHGLLGDHVEAHSYHHQAVVSHPGYAATGHAADGTLESMEDPDARFAIGVQWHPEPGEDDRLFVALVEAARHR